MNEIVINLVGDFLWMILGVSGALLGRRALHVTPTRRLWRVRDPAALTICAATSTRTDTGEYYRPATGIGQVRALALIVTSLNRAYRGFRVKSILLSEDQVQDRIENDLILLGGPKNNRVSRMFLDKLATICDVVDQQGSRIIWKKPGEEAEFEGKAADRTVTRDYGLLVRMQNPFSGTGSSLCLFSGGHTYGTIAAARYFTETLFAECRTLRGIPRNLVVIVACDVMDGYPTAMTVVRRHAF